MNKVININLAGRLLPIDDEAYSQLTTYLNWLKQHFGKEKGGMEIYSDMEDRIAELFHDKLKKDNVSIAKEDVQSVIKIMGSPEQIVMETSDEFIEPEIEQLRPAQGLPQSNLAQPSGKKLVRNANDKILGGVCSGVASYLNVDVAVVRIAFVLLTLLYGSGVLLYFLLWIALPAYFIPTTQLKRRLYRDLDGKILGGVCKGLSAYMNVSVNWLRLFFAFPLLGIIFFNIINENELASFSTAAFPTLSLLYIVLWAILPKASTLTDKMDLRGEKIDVQNLSAALKTENSAVPTPVRNSGSNFFVVLLKIFAYTILFFVLGTLALVLIAILIGLLALLFGFSTLGVAVMPFSNIIFEHSWQSSLLYISAILAAVIPIVAIIRWLIHLIKKPKKTNKWVGYGLGITFMLSIFTLFYVGSDLFSDVKKEFILEERLSMVQPKDTLTIGQIRDSISTSAEDFTFVRETVAGGYEFEAMSVKVVPSADSLYHLNLIRQSNGKNVATAQQYATAMPFRFAQDSSGLSFPRYISLGGPKVYRGQLLTAEVQIPKGKVFRMGDIPKSFSKSWRIKGHRGYTINVNDHPNWKANTLYKMENDGSISPLP
ncbi:hypothetical protein DBR32_05710 [Taibaiella sp. KBW10]|uniref:PspC domain-containing protein n=1 Tax=Taibaiella sp. KBW10 TaxID=2153357 RepID=UPI000F5B2F1E|nr:PspC domain-containing protein [Taibaiella sp. KBW10]RQO31458.1 hypothetical protein DBR32_05710 [Taibaiella sp. KBW10]